jgi:hypothetical protein
MNSYPAGRPKKSEEGENAGYCPKVDLAVNDWFRPRGLKCSVDNGKSPSDSGDILDRDQRAGTSYRKQ